MVKSTVSVLALPILIFLPITSLAIYVFKENAAIVTPWFEEAAERGKIGLANGTFILFESYWPFDFLNRLWGQINLAFIPSTLEVDELSWWQMFSFLADAGPVYAIWVLESNRRANARTTASVSVYYHLLVCHVYELLADFE